ncbi:MAG: hypothetical protein AUG51_03890 [Acidobacteria bacterium 13_1_20CM_3_53_8]|nr:MAG: hypothetical protein AUG51_03890 [Acidobacteria bacterium 13_1_20CM_3_53_8]
MRHGIPDFGDQEQHVTAADVNRSMQNPCGPTSSDRDADLLSDPPVAANERWSLGDDDLIEHQHDDARVSPEAAF